MLTLPLTIRYSDRPLREAAAWFIPGRNAQSWLHELAEWGIPLAEIKLHIVPISRDDRRPRGLLAIPPGGMKMAPRVSSCCQAYGRIGERLYLPIEAALEPEAEAAELSVKLSADAAAYVMHPVAGFVRFDPADVRKVSDLLAAPPRRPAQWDRAQPGIGYNRRLLAVGPEQALDLASFMEAARDDIGSESPSLDSLPPAPSEPSDNPISQAGRQIAAGFGKMVQWIAGQMPSLGGKVANKLGDWARRLTQRQQQALDNLRHREIQRLLHMLDANPDDGLRFAIPFTSEPHRGVAPPSARLGRRDVSFNLRGLGGGRADYWDLREEHRRRLATRYRELANREIQLGRHRRAAYIFAKLLGDYNSAAKTLVEGHHYREAAALYHEKLGRPLDAARCLENGGLVSEAISIYEELKQFEKVGDLYTALDQPENARAAYLREIEWRRFQNDHLGTARLLETKLAASDEALAELECGWPDSEQAGHCLAAQFELLARLGRHADAERRIDSLDHAVLNSDKAQSLIDRFATLAVDYPDSQIRDRAADRTRVIVSERLAGATETRRRALVAAVGRLVPADLLLPRDCHRYLSQQTPPPVPPPPPRAIALKECRIVSQFKLPSDVTWKALCAAGDIFYAAGYRGCEVIMVRGRWDGRLHQPTGMPWRVAAEVEGAPILMAANQETPLVLHVVGAEPLFGKRFFPETDLFPAYRRRPLEIATRKTIGIERPPYGVLWMAEREADHIVMSAYTVADKLSATRALFAPPDNPELNHAIPLPMHARKENVYVGLGEQLVILKPDEEFRILEMPGFVRTLSGSAVHSRTRILATFDRGGAIFWDDYDSGYLESFATDMTTPLATFSQRGWLAVVGRNEYQIYGTHDRRLALKAAGIIVGEEPIAVVPTDHADQFAVCDQKGNVVVLQMPLG
jgi:hypothetical protein